jgi:hypothetical protein
LFVYLTLPLEPKLFVAAFRTTVLLPKLVGAAPHFVLDVTCALAFGLDRSRSELLPKLTTFNSVRLLGHAVPFRGNFQPHRFFSGASQMPGIDPSLLPVLPIIVRARHGRDSSAAMVHAKRGREDYKGSPKAPHFRLERHCA